MRILDHIYQTDDDLDSNVADILVQKITRRLAHQPFVSLILCGGNTPRCMYGLFGKRLAEAKVNPRLVYFFLGDERHVAPDSSERNEKMIVESLFADFQPPKENFFFWPAPPASPETCAAFYDSLASWFFTDRMIYPDIALLGLGNDGHTASLFPGGLVRTEDGMTVPLSAATPGNALAIKLPGDRGFRLTLSAQFLKSSQEILFMVGGKDKKDAFRRLCEADPAIPAGWVVNNNTSIHASAEAIE